MFTATIVMQQLEMIQLAFRQSFDGSHEDRREAFKDTIQKLDALLMRVLPGKPGE